MFLSYSRADRPRVAKLAQALEAAGHDVWWDRAIEGGSEFADQIARELDAADAVVVAWSETSVKSAWVRDEAGVGRDARRLVPVQLDATLPPLGFRQIQTIDLADWKGRGSDHKLTALVTAIASVTSSEKLATPVAAPAVGIDRRMLLRAGVAALAAGGGAAWWFWQGPAAGTANSVAVLPFVNTGGDPAQSYFSDGLATEVRTELARNPLLQVAAQVSSNNFRDRSEDAKTIATKLGVAYLLDGSVRRAGDILRIAAELIDGRTGFSTWTQVFDRPVADVFAVQAEIAAAVTAALTAQLRTRRPATAPDASGTGTTTDVAAFDAFLRGRDLFDQAADEATDRAALAKFDAAIAADPGYGLAHAARSRTLTVIANQYVQGEARRALYDDALVAAERATKLAPNSADAWAALGFLLFNGRLDARAARGPYDRSFDLGAGDADVLSGHALFCARTGRFDQARISMARSAALDPQNGRTVRLQGEVEFVARRFADAVPLLERALVINPKMGVARSALGSCKFLLGDIRGAEAAFAAEPNRLFGLTGLAIVHKAQKRDADAARALTSLIAEFGDNAIYQQAQVAAAWGELAQVMPLLTAARTQGDAGIMYARNDPFLDPVRDDPAFKDLLSALGFA